MSKRRISILTQLTGMSFAVVISAFTVFGYTLYQDQEVTNVFDKLINRVAEKALDIDISNSQPDFSEAISDVQEIISYDDTTLLSVIGITQYNFQVADDTWEEVYQYIDEIQGK